MTARGRVWIETTNCVGRCKLAIRQIGLYGFTVTNSSLSRSSQRIYMCIYAACMRSCLDVLHAGVVSFQKFTRNLSSIEDRGPTDRVSN